MAAYEQAARYRAQAVEALDAAHADRRPPARARCSPPPARPCCTPATRQPRRLRFGQARAIARRIRDAPLLARAALGHGGLGVEIMDVDSETRRAARGGARGRRSERPGPDVRVARAPRRRAVLLAASRIAPMPQRRGGATARRTGDPRTMAVALNARHVGLWRPDRLADRREVADEMLRLHRRRTTRCSHCRPVTGDRRPLRVGDMSAWRAEVTHTGARASCASLPYTWYATSGPPSTRSHAGASRRRPSFASVARAEGSRQAIATPTSFAEMLVFEELIREDFQRVDPAVGRASHRELRHRRRLPRGIRVDPRRARPRAGGARAPRADRRRPLRLTPVRRQLALGGRRGEGSRTAARRPDRGGRPDRPDALCRPPDRGGPRRRHARLRRPPARSRRRRARAPRRGDRTLRGRDPHRRGRRACRGSIAPGTHSTRAAPRISHQHEETRPADKGVVGRGPAVGPAGRRHYTAPVDWWTESREVWSACLARDAAVTRNQLDKPHQVVHPLGTARREQGKDR